MSTTAGDKRPISEKQRAHLARAREAAKQKGALVGRPAGALNQKTLDKIKTREAFVAAGLERAGKLLNDLDRNASAGDTKAATAILDRVGIAPITKVEIEHKFSLRQIAQAAPPINGTPDMRILNSEDDSE